MDKTKVQISMLSSCEVSRALIARLVFGGHALGAVSLAWLVTKEPLFWLLSLPILLFVIEGCFTIRCMKANWKWFIPCIFIYLLSTIPSIWVMELNLQDSFVKCSNISENNNTINFSDLPSAILVSETNETYDFGKALKDDFMSRFHSNCSWETPVNLYEQSFMFVLIIGYWLDPLRSLDGDEKSELLLVNLGIVSDVLEFLEMSKEIREDDASFTTYERQTLLWLTLALWTWSLSQFILLIKGFKANAKTWEVWLSLMLMDVPYLVFRLVMIIHFHVISKSMFFFTAKNILVITIQIYGIIALWNEKRTAKRRISSLEQEDVIPPNNRKLSELPLVD